MQSRHVPLLTSPALLQRLNLPCVQVSSQQKSRHFHLLLKCLVCANLFLLANMTTIAAEDYIVINQELLANAERIQHIWSVPVLQPVNLVMHPIKLVARRIRTAAILFRSASTLSAKLSALMLQPLHQLLSLPHQNHQKNRLRSQASRRHLSRLS